MNMNSEWNMIGDRVEQGDQNSEWQGETQWIKENKVQRARERLRESRGDAERGK